MTMGAETLAERNDGAVPGSVTVDMWWPFLALVSAGTRMARVVITVPLAAAS